MVAAFAVGAMNGAWTTGLTATAAASFVMLGRFATGLAEVVACLCCRSLTSGSCSYTLSMVLYIVYRQSNEGRTICVKAVSVENYGIVISLYASGETRSRL